MLSYSVYGYCMFRPFDVLIISLFGIFVDTSFPHNATYANRDSLLRVLLSVLHISLQKVPSKQTTSAQIFRLILVSGFILAYFIIAFL